MKTNKLRAGLKNERKLKDSFYYFIVDNKIDWAIILGSIFCILPYLASKSGYFILIKSIIMISIIYLALRYLKTWNSLRDVDLKMKGAIEKIKGGLKIDKTDNISDFQKEFGDKLILLANDYKNKSGNYKDFVEYLKYDKEIPMQVDEFLNKDRDLTFSFINLSLGVFLVLSNLRILPKLRMNNYFKLLAIIILTFTFFIFYAVENSI